MKLAILVLLLFVAASASATTHIIQFGNTLGLIYEPKDLTGVAIGDTIQWEGFFTFHPLASTQIPNGAEAFAYSDTAKVFIYVPQVNGEYKYICTAHEVDGMVGSFIVGEGSVKETKLVDVELFQNVPNPALGSTTISFDLEKPAHITLTVYTLAGNEVAKLADGTFGGGINTIPFNTADLPSGIYMYRLTIGDEAITRQLIVTK